MDIDLMPFFEKYEALLEKVKLVFEQMKTKYPNEVQCMQGCSDCCHALFDLTLIEALYLNYHFKDKVKGEERTLIIEAANTADRKIYKIKKAAYKLSQEGSDDEKVIQEISKKRICCPLLGEKDLCVLYDYRPIACRAYGIPQAIGGKGHSCGLSGFKAGESYPTFNHDIVHDQLIAISAELVQAISSKNFKMADMLVPVSMALLTDYNEDYLGIATEEKPETDKNQKGDREND